MLALFLQHFSFLRVPRSGIHPRCWDNAYLGESLSWVSMIKSEEERILTYFNDKWSQELTRVEKKLKKNLRLIKLFTQDQVIHFLKLYFNLLLLLL